MASGNQRNVKWVEGLRGITSILVMVTHISRAWDFPLFWPSNERDVGPRLLQLPILRTPFQGRIGVPIFAFLTGFVCAYKPLKLAYQQSNAPAALHSVARSAFRRPPRLVLPAVMATLITMLFSWLGFFRVANRCDSFWVRFDSPDPVGTLGDETRRFFHTVLTTWTNTENLYDRHQWAMRPLLIGAFQVYIVLAATIGMRFKYRVTVHALLMVYWLMNSGALTETFGANLALGTLLAELSLHRPTQNFIAARHRFFSCVVAPIIALVGLIIGSYPQEHEDWSAWSMWLHKTFVDPAGDGSRGTFLVPHGTNASRRTSAFMVQLCAISIFLSPGMREALSHRYLLWLGRHSFAVYLVHGTILRTVGTWIVYGITAEPGKPAAVNGDGSKKEEEFLKAKGLLHIRMATVIFIALTYLAAWAWMRWVDASCTRATEWLERKVFQDEEEEESDGKHASAEKGFTNGNASACQHWHGERKGHALGSVWPLFQNGFARGGDSNRIHLSP